MAGGAAGARRRQTRAAVVRAATAAVWRCRRRNGSGRPTGDATLAAAFEAGRRRSRKHRCDEGLVVGGSTTASALIAQRHNAVIKRTLLIAVMVVVLACAAVWGLNVRDEPDLGNGDAAAAPPASKELVERGRTLARVGNCATCHTARGGAAYAGGRAVETPFGAVYASNLTPDEETGIGRWSAGHFWRAMHNGRSRDGRLLYPAFPYPNYTRITREDSDAIHAYLRSLPAVRQANRPHGLRFPYSTQAGLAVWRALYFSPERFEVDGARPADWNRGAYLVQGLGHCSACHSSRNEWGGQTGSLDLSGGVIPMQNWYAPALDAPDEAGLADWSIERIVELMKSGLTNGASVSGPMAEVVQHSTQFLGDDDLRAMATYLKSLPQRPASARRAETSPPAQGAKLYEQHCAQCHGESGQGVSRAYPALAGNRAVMLDPPANVVRMVQLGGFPPATEGNPRPFGMPPFMTVLSDAEIAAVVTYIRTAWGNTGAPVTTLETRRYLGEQQQR
jgi:mono/diheme cytochrome c family protein